MFFQDIDRLNGSPDEKLLILSYRVIFLLCSSIMSIMSEVF